MPGTLVADFRVDECDVTRVCCHCRRVRTPSGWRAESEPTARWITHVICPPCFQTFYPEIAGPPSDDRS